MFKIGLIGHTFCGKNYGVGALTFGEVYVIEETCRKLGITEYEIVCFETDINNTYNDNPKVKLVEFNLKNVAETAKKLRKMNIIFDISGGDSFSDIYGTKLYIIQMLIKTAVMLSGKPYIVAPQTIGPFKSQWARWSANYYIQKATAAFARDEMSAECLSKSNAKKVVAVTDLGLLMPYEPAKKNQQFTVGFNVSGLLYQSDSLLGDTIDYRHLCNLIIQQLLSKGYQVLLIPHVVITDKRTIDNDYYICSELAKKYQLSTVPAFSSPKEVKHYISQCDFFIGSRMHATIGAVSSGVPTLAMAYSRKFKGVFEGINYYNTIDLRIASEANILTAIEKSTGEGYQQVVNSIRNSKKIINLKIEKYIDSLQTVFEKSCL